MTPIETAFTFYLVTGILGCIALTIYGHRRIILIALGLLVVALIVLVWRNRRRVPRLPFVAIEEREVQVDGHGVPAEAHPSPGRNGLSGTPPPQKPSGAQLSGMGILIAAAMIVPLILGVPASTTSCIRARSAC